VLGLHFTEQLVLPPLLIRPASHRFSKQSPVSAIFLHLDNFLSPLHLLIHVFSTRFNLLVLGCPTCLLHLHINHTAPLSILIHPSFVNGLYLHLFSILSPMHDFRLPLPYFSWCLCSSWMLCGICWLVQQYSALSQSNPDMIRKRGRLQYAVDTLQSATFVLQIKAEGKHTSLTWKWKQIAMKQS